MILSGWLLDGSSLSAQPTTFFHLKVNPKKNLFLNQTGHFQPVIKGGDVISDSIEGPCLRLGSAGDNGITVPDPGNINFKGGLTFEIRICFDETPPTTGTSLALKPGSFSWDLVRSKMHVSWMSFPGEPVFTDRKEQLNYYPVGTELINGLMEVPLHKWLTLTWSYDEALGCITTYVNGLTDRKRYRYRGPETLNCDGKSPFTFLKGFKNCRISSLSLRSGRPNFTKPSMEVYASPLPYQDKLMVTFDHIDPTISLPIEVTLLTEKASGQAFVTQRLTLDSYTRKDVLLDLPTWKNSLHTLMVHATSSSKAVYQQNIRFVNPKVTGKTRIATDLSIVSENRSFFPLLIYHARPEDFGKLANMGFNVIYNNFNLIGAPPEILLKKSLDSAQKHNLFLLAAANGDWGKLKPISVAKDHPATLGWYAADEPYGDLSRLVESYNTTKLLDPDLPVLVMMNNYSRLQEAAMGCDILGVDPYPIPKVSLRMVYDATRAAVKAVNGEKPIWTTIPQYDEKIPTLEELRCMAWLAIAGGANGLGIFEWDHRVPGKTGGWLMSDSLPLVANLTAVIKEMGAMESVLLTPSSLAQPTILRPNPAVHVLLKEKDGKRFLVVASDSRQSETLTLELQGAKDQTLHSLLTPEKAPAPILQKGKLQLDIPAHGVAVYPL